MGNERKEERKEKPLCFVFLEAFKPNDSNCNERRGRPPLLRPCFVSRAPPTRWRGPMASLGIIFLNA